ncbi:MAG: FGGY-family carbohydrate kinase [Firmicutes bacterium]|jgi:xylulokinase|nr:FGGY-family carbohydrate kinase [Bacillota bacterium]
MVGVGETLLIGIDIGTTSVKGTLIDTHGRILAEASQEHDLLSPQVGWAEEKPEIWWANTKAVLAELAGLQEQFGGRVKAISASGMVPALVILDEAGNPLRNSIQQNDARTFEEIAELKAELDEEEFFRLTGGSINQQNIPPRLLWLYKHEPEVMAKARLLMGSYDYITYKLTGKYSLERNWALESGMYDVHQEQWIPWVLAAAKITEEWLPPVYAPGEVLGNLLPELAAELGFDADVVVAVGSGDHVASAFSAGVKDEGDVLIKFGGAGDILTGTKKLVTDKRIFLDYHLVPGQYLLNGCMASSGSLVKWFARTFFAEQIEAYDREGKNFYAYLDELAAKIPVGSDGIITLPYFIGEKTPIMDAKARGVFFGLSLHHRAEHLYRSVLEAVGYGFYHHIVVFREMGLAPSRYYMSNGGSRSRLWRQIVTDTIGAPVEYITKHPGSSLGAAFIAGMAIGAFKEWSEIERYITERELMEPNLANHERYQEFFEIYRNLYLSLREDFHRLNEISTR